VYGDGYDSAAGPSSEAQPRHGFSKDHRPDLKQMVLNLATTGSAAFPIWMEPQNGNASDKKVLHEAAERMKCFCAKLKEAPSFLFVADSAMYDACVKEAGDLLWLSRVPASHQAAKDLLRLSDDKLCFVDLSNGYRMCVVETMYHGIHQRWAIISSEHAYKREIITLEKRIEKEHVAAKNSLWHASNQSYKCEQDAEDAAIKLSKKLKYHTLSTNIIAISKHARSGRPRKGEDKVVSSYRIEGEIKRDEVKIEPVRLEKGRFILATNELDRTKLSDEEILPEYKAQSGTESGFKFIKDDAFEVASIFLKKPERIAALMMIMTLCLMVYNFAQYKLRSSLQQAKDTIPNPLNKATDNPTMKRVYRLFHGVHVITISLENSMQELVINLNAVTRKIVQYFGPVAMNIYGLTPI
jgi:transposase